MGGKPLPTLEPWLAELVEGYERALIRRGRSMTTVVGYRTPFRDFGRWLAGNEVRGLVEIELRHVEGWQDSLVGRWSVSYQAVAIAGVKGLLKWCARQKLLMSDPMLCLQIDTPYVPPMQPRPIPLADLQALHRALWLPEPNLVFLRTRALFWALFSTGSRITAMLSLNRDSVRDGQAVIFQKGGGQHTLLFSDKAVEALADYLRFRTDDNIALFVGHSNTSRRFQRGMRLGKVNADLAWYRLADGIGIARFSSHRIRHSCATTMLRNKVNHVIIARHMGHKGLAMISRYTEVDLDQRREAVASLSVGA